MLEASKISYRKNFILEFPCKIEDTLDELRRYYYEKVFHYYTNFTFFAKCQQAEKTILIFRLRKKRRFNFVLNFDYKGQVPVCERIKSQFIYWINKLGQFEVVDDWDQNFTKFTKIEQSYRTELLLVNRMQRLCKDLKSYLQDFDEFSEKQKEIEDSASLTKEEALKIRLEDESFLNRRKKIQKSLDELQKKQRILKNEPKIG